MSKISKSDLINKIKSEYNKKLKALEAKLALKHKELNQIESAIKHDTRVIDHSNISKLRLEKAEINTSIISIKKEIKKLNRQKDKKLRKV